MTTNPTLQRGAESPDGWVEYLHDLLNEALWGRKGVPHLNGGRFDENTETAVKAFQADHHLSVDGVVGNQTWAALTGTPVSAPVGGDGRHPNSYVEQGVELRFDPGSATAYADGVNGTSDQLILRVVNVGSERIETESYRPAVFVKHPDGSSFMPTSFSTFPSFAQPGGWYEIFVEGVSGNGPAGRYSVMAQLPGETGGDTIQLDFDRQFATI